MGALHACGLTADGEAYCWGDNSDGQLGDGTFEYRNDVVRVIGGHRFASLSLRSFRSCGVTVAGELYCWGGNPTAAVTPGLKALQETHRAAPVRVAEGLTVASVAVGDRHVCGLTTAGQVYCWGDGRSGQLGSGSGENSATPAHVPLVDSVVAVTVGADHACALGAQGTARCWGRNIDGQLGDLRFRALSAGDRHTCGVTTSDEVYCWGWNFHVQLGVPADERCGGYPCSSTPLRVVAAPHLVSLSAGAERSCGLASDGHAQCWGGRSPMLPDTGPQAWLPAPILPQLAFTALSLGHWRMCGVTTASLGLCVSVRVGLPAPPTPVFIPWKLILYTLAGALVGMALVWLIAKARGEAPRARDLVFAALYGAALGFVFRALQAFSELFRSLG